MAITGTGTQADPYLPETWEEILQCTSSDNVYTTFPQNAIFDMNNYYPDGIGTGEIVFRGFIDGNGSVIKNACYNGDARAIIMSDSDTKGKIINLDFLNFYFKATRRGATLIGVTSAAVDNATFSGEAFYNCRFSGLLSSTDVDYCAITQCGYNGYISCCSYNIKAISRGCNLDTGNFVAQHRNCNIMYEAAYGAQMALADCYVEGSATELNIYSKGSSQSSNTSILNFAADSITGTRTYQNMILVNTDRYSGTLPTGFIGVTDAQLKDAGYLSSIGFPIGVTS